MSQVNVNQATVLELPIRTLAAAVEVGDPSGSGCSGSVVSDSIVADTNASADACPGEWQQCCLSLQQAVTSKPSDGHFMPTSDPIASLEEGSPGDVPHTEPGTDEAGAVHTEVKPAAISTSGCGDSKEQNDLETSPVDFAPSHVPAFVLSASHCMLKHPDGQTQEQHTGLLKSGCESKHTHPIASKSLPSPAFSSPACLEAHQLPAYFQLTSQQRKCAASCNTSFEPRHSSYPNPASCSHMPAESHETPLSPTAPCDTVPTSVAAVESASAMPVAHIDATNAAADVLSHGAHPSRLYAAVEAPVNDSEYVPGSSSHVQQELPADTCPLAPQKPGDSLRHAVPDKSAETLSEHHSMVNPSMDSHPRLEVGDVCAASCSTARGVPHEKQPVAASPRPVRSGEHLTSSNTTPQLSLPAEHKCTRQVRPLAVTHGSRAPCELTEITMSLHSQEYPSPLQKTELTADFTATASLQEGQAAEETPDMDTQIDLDQVLIDLPAAGTGDDTPVSILCRRVCAPADTPVLCSSIQPISPAKPSATSPQQSASEQEPRNDPPGSPTTPTVQRRLQFSWNSPPATPTRVHVSPRLGLDEAENVPVIAPYLNTETGDVEQSPLASPLAEVGSETWINSQAALDGFSASDTTVPDTLVLPPVLGAARSVQPLQAMEVDRTSNSSCSEEDQGVINVAPGPVHHHHKDAVPAHQPSISDYPPVLPNGNESPLTILQKAKELLDTGRPISDACSDRPERLWRQRTPRAAASTSRSETVSAIQSTKAPASNPPAPVPTPTRATDRFDPTGLASVPHHSVNASHNRQDASTAPGNLKRRSSSSGSLQPAKNLPANVVSSEFVLKSQKEAKVPQSVASQPVPQTRITMFTKKRAHLTSVSRDGAAPQSSQPQKKEFCGKRLLAAIIKGSSSTGARDLRHNACKTAKDSENRTVAQVPQQQSAHKTSPDKVADCQTQTGTFQYPPVDALSKKAPQALASSCTVMAVTAKCSPRNMLGKRKLGSTLLQHQLTVPFRFPATRATDSPCERSAITTCSTGKGADHAACIPESIQVQQSESEAPTATCLSADIVRDWTPNPQAHVAPWCEPAHRGAAGSDSPRPQNGTKQALVQEPLITAARPRTATMDTKARHPAKHECNKESGSGASNLARKFSTPKLRKLLESYETPACGTLVKVGSQSLSIISALQLQHNQGKNSFGGVPGDCRTARQMKSSEHVSDMSAVGKALHQSKHPTQGYQMTNHEAQRSDDAHRHRQFMAAMYRQLHYNGSEQGVAVPSGTMSVPDTFHITDPHTHYPYGGTSSRFEQFQGHTSRDQYDHEDGEIDLYPQQSSDVLNATSSAVVSHQWENVPEAQTCGIQDTSMTNSAFTHSASKSSLDDSLSQELRMHDEVLQPHMAACARGPSHNGGVASLRDVLEASKRSTIVRLMPVRSCQGEYMPGATEGCMANDAHGTARHYATDAAPMAAKRLMQLYNCHIHTPSARRVEKVAQLKRLMYAIQESEGEDVSIPSSSCSPAASSWSADADNKSKRAREKDCIIPDVQPQKQRCKGRVENRGHAHLNAERGCLVRTSQNVLHRQRAATRRHHVSRMSKVATVQQPEHLQHARNTSTTTTEYHCKSVKKTETVVTTCSDIFKGL